jgi:hypothetical protein
VIDVDDAPPSAPAPPSPSVSPTSSSFADTPSLLAEPKTPAPPAPTNDGPLFAPPSDAPAAFAPPPPPPAEAFAPSPPPPPASAFAPVSDPMSDWNDEPDDGLSSFHEDSESVPLFGDSPASPGADDPFGPDPFNIPTFSASPAEAREAKEAAELARQLANLSPRAQQAVAAAAAADTDEERSHAIDQVERSTDEPINRNLLLKYLSSVDE